MGIPMLLRRHLYIESVLGCPILWRSVGNVCLRTPPHHLHNGNRFDGKTAFLHWIRTLSVTGRRKTFRHRHSHWNRYKWWRWPWKALVITFNHCGLVAPYGRLDLGQHWFSYWLVSCRHQAITWTNVDLSSNVFWAIHLIIIWQGVLVSFICNVFGKLFKHYNHITQGPTC